jgi:hypothetical protein
MKRIRFLPGFAVLILAVTLFGACSRMSNTYPGEGGADVYVGSDEFQMGVMMSAMLAEWAGKT